MNIESHAAVHTSKLSKSQPRTGQQGCGIETCNVQTCVTQIKQSKKNVNERMKKDVVKIMDNANELMTVYVAREAISGRCPS